MTTTPDPSYIDPLSSGPRVARLVEEFRDALVRMRDGEDLTADDLNVAGDLVQMMQTPTGTTLAAAVIPQFREVFQSRRDGSAPAEESTVPATSDPAPRHCVLKYPEPRWW
ncbi:hypothetical protein ACFWBR_39770 [Streptomyces sp. NPDC060006]|uniref:hypothetical protein n=1 Tax=unclassified Streptomyces TaxID=2593676 RepID=UPI0036346133